MHAIGKVRSHNDMTNAACHFFWRGEKMDGVGVCICSGQFWFINFDLRIKGRRDWLNYWRESSLKSIRNSDCMAVGVCQSFTALGYFQQFKQKKRKLLSLKHYSDFLSLLFSAVCLCFVKEKKNFVWLVFSSNC